MKKSNLIKLLMLPLLLVSTSGCNETNNEQEPSTDKPSVEESIKPSTPVDPTDVPSEPETPSDTPSDILSDLSESIEEPTEEPSYNFDPKEDVYGLLPERVKNAELEIDLLIYIVGQDGVMKDIGNYSPDLVNGIPTDLETGEQRKYGPEDIKLSDLAKFVGAAQEFKKYAPGVKINVIYCTDTEYNNTMKAYNDQYGHLPHIMHPVDQIVEMLEQGYCADVSKYSDAEYYDSYNEFFMTRFNFGGFQAAIPLQVQPWGIFVNTGDLEKYYVVSDVYNDNKFATDAYKNWVDNFTWESFIEAVKKCTTSDHAGLSKVFHSIASTSMASIYNQYITEGSVDMTSDEIIGDMKKLLEYENELAMGSKYTTYLYNESSVGTTPNHELYPNCQPWNGNLNFLQDQYSTFYAEAPWAVPGLSQYINEYNLKDSISIDVLPYPKFNSESEAYSGVGVGGLVIGNQCPVDVNGNEACYSETSLLEQEVAAYFAMFMNADPRATESRNKVKYFYNDVHYTGDITLPLVKKGFRYSWQDNPDLSKDDPAQAFADNWQYQLSLYLKLYNAYITDGKEPDVVNFTNITYGLTSMLDSIYGERVTALNYATEPRNVFENHVARDIFEKWDKRHTYFIDPDTLSGFLGSSNYVDTILARLPEIEDDINTNAEMVWYDLQDNVDMYYGYGIYDILDRSYRNDYEGSIIE